MDNQTLARSTGFSDPKKRSTTGTHKSRYIEPEPLKPIEPISLLDSGIARYEDHRGKAKMLIFNQFKFDKDYEDLIKCGEKDGNDLEVTFKKFGFEVKQHVNLKKNDIFEKLKEVPIGLKCIAIAVLSHGGDEEIAAYDEYYYEKDILKCFENRKDLNGVPKLFIFEICRKETPINLSLSDEDMIVLHATYFDEFAYYNKVDGSWFTQTLCQRLNLMKKKNLLLDEMTFVMRDLSLKYQGKQMPIILYNTKKHFYLNPCDNNTTED